MMLQITLILGQGHRGGVCGDIQRVRCIAGLNCWYSGFSHRCLKFRNSLWVSLRATVRARTMRHQSHGVHARR
jgi:hypothetical protein